MTQNVNFQNNIDLKKISESSVPFVPVNKNFIPCGVFCFKDDSQQDVLVDFELKSIGLEKAQIIVKKELPQEKKLSAKGYIIFPNGSSELEFTSQELSLEDGTHTLTVEYTNVKFKLLEQIGKYHRNYLSNLSEEQKFQDSQKRPFVEWNYHKLGDDLTDICKLRRKAYSTHIDRSTYVPLSVYTNELDTYSHIIEYKANGKLVGTIRITAPTADQNLEIYGYGLELPEDMPKRSDLLEISKLSIDPEFDNKSAVLIEFVKLYLYHFVKSDRRQIVAVTIPDLKDLYTYLGANVTEIDNMHTWDLLGGNKMLLTYVYFTFDELKKEFFSSDKYAY